MKFYFRHFYWRWLKNQAYLLIFFLILMSFARGGFAFVFGELVSLKENFTYFQKAMFLGLRYDLMPLAYINILPFLIINLSFFIPGKKIIGISRFLIISILFLGYVTLGWLYLFDYSFYSYYQDHLNILFFGLFEDDTTAVLVSIWKNYNLVLWLPVIGFCHYAVYRLVKLMVSKFEFDLKTAKVSFKMPLTFVGGLVLLAFFARGTFNRLPLSVEDAHLGPDEFINEVALNGPLTLNRAIKIRKVFGKGEFDYLRNFGFDSWESAYKTAFGAEPPSKDLYTALERKTPVNDALKARPPHVIMVVMESFGSSWNDQNSADFNILGDLATHFKEDYLFKNFLPAENGTIGSIVSVATSQVIRPGARFLSESDYMSTALRSAGQLPFKESGYTTHFIYGGKLGWRDLGKFLRVQGYDHLWGAEEMKETMPELSNIEPRELGNEWGIFDEYLYSYVEEILKTATEPQFFLILTTSNHPPFEFPNAYRPLPLKLSKEKLDRITVDQDLAEKRFLALQYANQKMAEFLSRLKSSDKKDDVIVSLTGDHSYWISKGMGLEEDFKRYAVPFYLSVPERLKPSGYDPEAFGSHEDIFPTLYHLALSNQKYLSFGENIFSGKSFSMNSSGLVADKQGAHHHDKYWVWKDLKNQILEASPETPELLRLKLRATGMMGVTDAYLKEEKKNRKDSVNSDQL